MAHHRVESHSQLDRPSDVLDEDDWEAFCDELAELAKRNPEEVSRWRVAASRAGLPPGEWLLEALDRGADRTLGRTH